MNKKDLKKLIRQDIISSTPDILSKIDLSKVSIEPREALGPVLEQHHYSLNAMKFALSFMFVMGFGIFLIFGTGKTKVQPAVLTDKEQIYTFSAVSATSLFNSIINVPQQSGTLSPIGKNGKLKVEDHIDILNQYMNVIETLIGNKNLIKYEMLPSDRPEYAFKVEYSIPDLIGNTLVQDFYYNETSSNENLNKVEGIMVSGTKEFILEGQEVRESGENKLTLVAYDAVKSRDNYVRVMQKKEQSEQKFSYEVVENGVVINKSEIKLEMDHDDIKAVLNCENEESGMKYEFKKETENAVQNMSIKYSISSPEGDEEGQLKVAVVKDETTGSYIYQYHLSSEDTEKDIEKERNKHEEDDEDEKSEEDSEEEQDPDKDSDEEVDDGEEKKDETDEQSEEDSEGEETDNAETGKTSAQYPSCLNRFLL